MQICSQIVFFLCFFSSAYFFQGPSANVNSRFDMALALVEDNTLHIDKYHKNTPDKAFHEGHYYSDKAPGLAFLEAVPLALVHPFFSNFQKPQKFYFQLYAVSLVFALFTGFTGLLFFRFALEILSEDQSFLALTLTLLCFLATLIYPYSTLLFSHQIAGNFLFISFYYLRKLNQLSLCSHLSLAFFISYGCLIEYTCAPWFLIFYIYLLSKSWDKLYPQKFFLSLIPASLVFLLFAFYNTQAFGGIWQIGYGFLASHEFATGMGQGFFGIKIPQPSVMAQLTFSAYRGLFYYNPVLLFSFVSIYFVRKQPEILKIVCFCYAVFFYFLLLNSAYTFWNGGSAFGPRHLVPSLILLCLPMLYLPKKWLTHPLFWILGMLGYFYMFVTTSVFVIIDEVDPQPFWNYIFPFFCDAKLSLGGGYPLIEIFNHGRLHPKWYSFNAGELLGLQGLNSLLPLLLLQILGVSIAYKTSRKSTQCLASYQPSTTLRS